MRILYRYMLELLDMALQSKDTEVATVENVDYSTAVSGRPEYIGYGLFYHGNYESYIGVNYDVSNRTETYSFGTYPDLEPIFENFMNNSPYNSIWIDSDGDGTKDALTAGSEVTIGRSFSFDKDTSLIIGVFGDNKFYINYDGTKIVSVELIHQYNFFYLHLFPITVTAGQHYFTFTGIGDGSVNDSLGAIIWTNTKAELVSPIPKTEWDVLYSSYDSLVEALDIVTCPDGYSYDNETNQCIRMLSIDSLTIQYYLIVTPLFEYTDNMDTASWVMDYGDGITEVGSGTKLPDSFEHQYTAIGNYTITLQATINDSKTYTDSDIITVS